jgi:dTMP kinase
VLIAIEGIDGSGTTTIARFLKSELEKYGYKTILLKEPTDSEWGRRLRESCSSRLKPEEELELFLKDREFDVRENIIPSLEEGKVVIMDRYYLSTIAYQGALGFDPVQLKEMNERIAPKPDLAFILDLPPEIAVSRVVERGDKPNDYERIEYLKRVRETFIWMQTHMENIFLVDATKSLADVKREVLSKTLELLERK